MRVDLPLASLRPECTHLPDALRFEPRVRLLDRDSLIPFDVCVHPDDRPLPALELDLDPVRRIRDLALDPTGLDRLEHPAAAVRLPDQVGRLRLQPIRERFDRERTADRIDRVRDADLMSQELL